jgi:serine/threonine-protein kinase RsbW
MITHVRQEYPSDLKQLAAMRQLVRQACRAVWGVTGSEEAINQVELAVDEAAANIVLHAYEGEPGRPIELVVEIDPEEVAISLYHCGRDFDQTAVVPPSFDGGREHGFGVYLIHQLVDQVTYLHNEQGRSGIRLVKKRA